MSIKLFNYHPSILAVLLILLAVFVGAPLCFAGGAVTIVQDKHQLAPRGSYIPERRVQEVLKKVEEYKMRVKQKEAMEDGYKSPEDEAGKPKSPDEK